MKKRCLLMIILMIMHTSFLFSQDVERITYIDLGPDGSRRITRTVDAIFIGYIQMEVRQEGNLMARYQCSYSYYDDVWSDWELTDRSPMPGTLNQIYSALQRDYNLFPNVGTVFPMGGGVTALKMMDIPIGQSKPFWWDKNGNSFFIFHKFYIIMN
jgi:hypothetical protein